MGMGKTNYVQEVEAEEERETSAWSPTVESRSSVPGFGGPVDG